MLGRYAFVVEGLDELTDLDSIPDDLKRYARMAVNHATDYARTTGAKLVREQVRFPASYLQPDSGRLNVTRRANDDRLEGVITARQRATSLARFAKSGTRKSGVSVEVHPGKLVTLKRGFLMNLKSGTEAGGNIGLAVRVPDKRPPGNAYRPAKISDDLYLLYGQSVDQVFRRISPDMSDDVSAALASEFHRLMDARI
jgi:hypothetical protein